MTRVVVPRGFGGPEQLTVEHLPTPLPGPGEVRVAVRAVGVNPYDWKCYSGLMGTDPGLLGALGNEAAGVVDAVGADVEGWSVGDPVVVCDISGSGYADHLVAKPAALLPKPAVLSFEQAAAVPLAGGTAIHALEAAGVRAGDVLLLHGAAGGVGSLTAQLARLRGARVVGTASPANHEYLRSIGAVPVTYGPGLVERVRAAAPGGVDAAVDAAGTDEAMDASLALIADRRRIVTLVGLERAAGLGVKALGFGPGADPGTEVRRAGRRTALELAGEGRLRVEVARTYPLDQVAQAHADSRSGHGRGKLVVVP